MNHSSTLQYLRLSLLIWVLSSVLAGNTGLSAETQTLLDMRVDESGELVVIFDESRIVRADDFLGDRVLYSSTDLKDWQEEARFPADFNLKEYRTGFEAGALTLFYRMKFEIPEPPDTVLVRFVDDPSPEEVQELLEAAGLITPVGILQTPLMTAQGDAPWIEFRATHDPAAAVNTLLASPVVEDAMVSDYLHALFVSNDPYFLEGKLWGMQSAEAGSGAEAAWAAGHTGSKEVVIAVLDTGLQLDHPDIVANLWTNPWEIAGNGIDDTGNGYIDDVHGWDFVNNRPVTGDLSSHGTHVAGTVGAEGGNALGVVGVAWNLKILPVIFLGPDGLGTYDNAARAYDYITDLRQRGVNIVAINNSWGGGFGQPSYELLHQRFVNAANAGILSINAAGNNAANVDVRRALPAWIDTSVPVRGMAADYNASITVAAHNRCGNLASFSNYGLQSVHLSAPGSLIYSTVPSSAYDLMSGTSMAAPHVAGAVALYTSVHNASPRAIRDALLASVTPVDSFESVIASGGRLNIPQFLATPPPELNRPPMAGDDEATFFDGPVEIDVLSNDNDPDGDPLSVVAFTHSRWGSVGRQSADSNFLIYTPPSERNIRRDSFTYVVGDGRGGTASATVTVMNGNFVNEPPVVNPDVVTVWQGESVPLTSLLWNDIDPNNDPIFLVCAGTLCGNGEFGPENGTIFIDFHRGEEVPFYRPNPRFTGTDLFRYQITDGELSAWGDVTMHVLAGEDAPVRRPQLRNPTPNQTSALKRPNFRWDTLRNAQAYDLEIHQDQAGNVIRAYTNLTTNAFKPSPTDALEGATTYFWRVRGVGASSATGPWSAFRSFMSRAELPDQAPRLLRPAASEPLVSLTPTFSWSVVDLATGYTVHIAQAVPDASGLAFTLSTTGGTTSATLPAGSQLESDQSYFWRARAVNADGAGPWSDWRPFFTGDNDLPPGRPILVAPAHNAPSVSTIPTLQWQAVPGEVSYRVQIHRVNRAGQVVREYAQVSATQVTVEATEPLAGDRLFDWRVRAENRRGAGAWSVMRRFRTSLPAPGLIAPVEGASHQSLTPTFQWQGVPGATLYTFQIAADSPDPAGIISRRTLETTGTSTTIPSHDPLQDSRTYFWRVKAEGPTLSSFSAWQSFTTQMGPPTAAPTLIHPQDGATERLVRPNFEWSAGPRAESFTLQILRVSTGETVREYTGLIATTFQPPVGDELAGDREFRWRTRAHNSAGAGPWSDWRTFRTRLLASTLLSPGDGAANQSRTPTFSWSSVSGATQYRFEIATAPRAAEILERRTVTTGGVSTSIPANDPLQASRTYFWRISSIGPTTQSISDWFSLTTELGPPTGTPTLGNPVHNSVEQPVRPTFTWTGGPNMATFGIEIRRVSSGDIVRQYNNLTGTSYQLPEADALSGDRQYDWRMRDQNSAGTGPWSDWSRFRTRMLPPILTTPTNHASNRSRTTAFAWNGSSGANNYTFEIAADAPDPAGILSRRTQTIPGTALTIPANEPLRANRTYFWRVRANGPTTGAYSTWFVFTTGN